METIVFFTVGLCRLHNESKKYEVVNGLADERREKRENFICVIKQQETFNLLMTILKPLFSPVILIQVRDEWCINDNAVCYFTQFVCCMCFTLCEHRILAILILLFYSSSLMFGRVRKHGLESNEDTLITHNIKPLRAEVNNIGCLVVGFLY